MASYDYLAVCEVLKLMSRREFFCSLPTSLIMMKESFKSVRGGLHLHLTLPYKMS